MKIKILSLFVLAAMCTFILSSDAYANDEETNDEEKFVAAYELKADVRYNIRSSPDFLNTDDNKVGLISKGSQFRVLEFKTLPNGAKAAKIRITKIMDDPRDYLDTSNEYWIYMGDETDFKLKYKNSSNTQADGSCTNCPNNKDDNTQNISEITQKLTEEQNVEYKGSLDEAIRKYSNSNKVKETIKWAAKYSHPKGRGRCYKYVKEALACGKKGRKGSGKCLIDSWYPGMAALSGKEALKKHGFVNLLDQEPYKTQITDPSKAPRGAVLVYSSGIPCYGTRIKDCGHIEIKTGLGGNKEYISDYHSNRPVNFRPGSRYKLKAVMVQVED